MDLIKEMNSLVESINVKEYEGQPVVSSREIADNFDKRHNDVVNSIENLTTKNIVVKEMFKEDTFEHKGNTYKQYWMNRDGFSLLVMGFTGQKALEWKLKYIEAFNKMENYIKNQTQDMYLTELKKVRDRLEKIENKINVPNQIEAKVNQVSDSDYKNNLRYGLAIQMNELNQKERELNGELIKIQEKKKEIRRIYAQL